MERLQRWSRLNLCSVSIRPQGRAPRSAASAVPTALAGVSKQGLERALSRVQACLRVTFLAPPWVQVVVDVREFRSALPLLLHQAGMTVVPLTLDIGLVHAAAPKGIPHAASHRGLHPDAGYLRRKKGRARPRLVPSVRAPVCSTCITVE